MSREDRAMAPRPVPLGLVERELALLPERHSLGTGTGGEPPAVRARTMNMVAVVTDRRAAARMSRVAAEVTRRYPARVIIVSLQPRGKPAGLLGSVSGRCRLTAGGQRQLCTEQIDLAARGHLTEHLPNAISSLLAADLPVCLWWLGPLPPRDGLLEVLASQADTLLTDAGAAPAPEAALRWLGGYLERRGGRPVPGEASWLLLEPWRIQVARAFDRPLPGYSWPDLDQVRIMHGGGAPSAAALLLGGWIVSRLGWEPGPVLVRKASRVHEMASRGRRTFLSFFPSPAPGGPGGIASLRLSSGKRAPLVIRLPGEGFPSCLWGYAPPAGFAPRPARRGPGLPPEELVCRVLGAAAPDPSFLPALRAVLPEIPPS